MKPFRDFPIRRKVSFIVMITSVLVLVLTCTAFITYEWVTFRGVALKNLATLGRIIADNSTAALRFKSQTEAAELLATLRADETIITAALFDTKDELFAVYSFDGKAPPHPGSLTREGHRFTPRHLLLWQPVFHENQRLGTLYIQSTLAAVHKRFLLYGGLGIVILLGSSLVAFALSHRLQKRITGPILDLAKTARTVSKHRNYSTRAPHYGSDELGELTDSFNDMLAQIEERDARISASEERLRVALAAADMGTWRYFLDRREAVFDENLNRLMGFPGDQTRWAFQDILDRIHPDDRIQVETALAHALTNGGTYFTEYRIIRPDGSTRWVRDRGRVVRGHNHAVEYLTGAAVDVTDRKEAEEEIHRLNADLEQRVAQRTAELAQTNKDLEAFTYSVSHDLRAPLRHMAGYAQILQEDHAAQLSTEAQLFLGRIVQSAGRMSQLIDDLLNLGRVGRQPLMMQMAELDEMVDFVLRELESETKNRRIEWQRQPLPTVKCDIGLLRLVFINLLSNALKYTRPREVAVITIGTVVVGEETAIFVRDNGVGFEPAYKEKLFGVFQRLHSSAIFEGTGVGLATVERIIRNHGGRIWAEGQPDQGATFYFTLPGL